MCLVLLSSTLVMSAVVDNIRLWRSPDSTRLVLDINANFKHKIFEIKEEHKLVIDIPNSRYQQKFDQKKFDNTPIKRLRYANHKEYLRIVLDLKTSVKYRSFALTPNEKYGHRLVIDLFDNKSSEEDVTITLDQFVKSNRDIVIAIDAGHGGDDPGALGPNREREKDVVLQISKRLKKLIDVKLGYRAELVRASDYFISLGNRYHKARSKKADLFLSIHADAFDDPRASGASVYALSLRGATSASARYLAERQNRSDLIGGVSEVSLKDKDQQVAKVLLDLSMASTLETSLKIGEDILQEMGNITKLHKKQVEQANFLVLKSPDVPSLLIETGFISNPKEARNLTSSSFQKKLVKRIFNGIQNYYQTYPPAGTLVYKLMHSEPAVVKIKRGDTLSEIAEKYGVSTSELKRYNKLKSNKIRIGQKLKIPR